MSQNELQDNIKNPTSLSSYEQKRKQKIAENKRKLEELGIANSSKIALRSTNTSHPSSKKKKIKIQNNGSTLHLRRSSRHNMTIPFVEYDPTWISSLRRSSRQKTPNQVESKTPKKKVEYKATRKDLKENDSLSVPKKGKQSIRELNANLEFFDNTLLGKEILPHGKSEVLQMAARDLAQPKFSLLSGIQAWKNCVMLFVNAESNNYNNLFEEIYTDTGMKTLTMIWYAQSNQREDSNIIQRLIRPPLYKLHDTSNNPGNSKDASKGPSEKVDVFREKDDPIVLFCRPIGTGYPYVYCGKLKYHKHENYAPSNKEKPRLRFVWELTDYEVLSTSLAFKNLIKA